jgi:hypothetical protein
MTLLQQAQQAMQGLATSCLASQTLAAQDSGQRFHCELSALDTMSCAFTSFVLESDRLAPAAIEELRRVAETLSARLTYLLEPIQPIEVDPDHCVVQMRSNPPQRDETRTSYYELLVARGGVLSLCRYEKDAGDVRRTVAAHVTREVFWRLLSDFSSVG